MGSGGAGSVEEVLACEINPAAAFALETNAAPKHIFQDSTALVDDSASAWCFKHGARCKKNFVKRIDLYIAGFSCKANSLQNSERFTKSPLASSHYESFLDCARFIRKFNPLWVILENVTGISLPTSKGKTDSVLDHVMKELHSVEGYLWRYEHLDSVCLPDSRPRVYFIGTRQSQHHMDKASTLLSELKADCEQCPCHHIDGFLLPNPEKSPFFDPCIAA